MFVDLLIIEDNKLPLYENKNVAYLSFSINYFLLVRNKFWHSKNWKFIKMLYKYINFECRATYNLAFSEFLSIFFCTNLHFRGSTHNLQTEMSFAKQCSTNCLYIYIIVEKWFFDFVPCAKLFVHDDLNRTLAFMIEEHMYELYFCYTMYKVYKYRH